MIGSDFITKTYDHVVRCSECGKKILKGEQALVSIRDGEVKKRVCSESCRLTFDDRFWRHAAKRNERTRKKL